MDPIINNQTFWEHFFGSGGPGLAITYFVMNCVGLVLNTQLVMVLRQSVSLIDMNVRWLFLSMSEACALFSGFSVINWLIDPLLYLLTDDTPLLSSRSICGYRWLPINFARGGLIFGLVGLSLDRVYATLKASEHKEIVNKKLWTSVVLAGVWLVTITSSILLFADSQISVDTQVMPHCSLRLGNRFLVIVIYTEFLIALIIPMIAYPIAMRTNQRIFNLFKDSGVHQSLTIRVLLKRNMDTTRMLFSSVIVQCICWMLVFVAGFASRLLGTSNHAYFIEMPQAVHVLLHPIVIAVQSDVMATAVENVSGLGHVVSVCRRIRNYLCCSHTNAVEPFDAEDGLSQEAKLYFNELQDQWRRKLHAAQQAASAGADNKSAQVKRY